MLKKIFKITGISLLVLIVLAFLIPIFFKGKIISLIKSEINKSLNAKVDFKDADISIFRHFPKLSLGLNDLNIVGIENFEGDTLLAVKNIDVSVNLISAIKGSDIKIYGVYLDEPRINAIMHKDGKANWDIAKPDTLTVTKSTEKEKPFKMSLNHYEITDGLVRFVDESSNLKTEIKNLNHEGSGDFTDDLFTLKTATTADALTVSYGGIPYLNKVKTDIDLDIEIDNKTNKYTFNTEKIKLNDMQLNTQGFFQLVNDSTYNMDINFKAPSTDFKNILSFIPAIYTNDFSSLKTSGQAVFNGFVKGIYSNDKIPAYNINLDVKNGFFQYPDLPMPVKNINLALKVDNPDGITDHTTVDIPNAHIELGNDPFDFRLLVKTPVSDLFVDAAAKGKIDLSQIIKFIKLEEGTKLNGLLNADVQIAGNQSAATKQQYEKFKAAGIIALNNFLYASKDYPAGVSLTNLLMTFNPKNVTVNNAAGKFMETNFSANGYINNILPYVFTNKPLDGVINVKADKIDLNKLMGVSTTTDTATVATENGEPFLVPANLNLTLNATADKVIYDKLDITNLSGSLLVANEAVQLNNIKGNALDGTMIINGMYTTLTNKHKPDINLSYNVAGLNIQKTFLAFNTVQKLMPIAKFLSGKLSSQLNVTGKLGGNMMPDLTTLSGAGNMLMLQGVLNEFAPLDKVASTLNINALQNISVKDIKTYFEFTNGKMLVKPFSFKVKDIDLEVGGTHGLNMDMDYAINMKVPRALMGNKANSLIDGLTAKANANGVPVKVGDIIPIKVKLGGSMLNPTVKTDLNTGATSLAQDMKQQAADFAKAKVDSTKQAVKDTLRSVKNQVVQSAKDEIAKKLLGGSSDTSSTAPKQSLSEKGKVLLKDINPFKKKKN